MCSLPDKFFNDLKFRIKLLNYAKMITTQNTYVLLNILNFSFYFKKH